MSEPDSEIAVFRATIPPYKSAIQAHGDGTGGSIRLEIPQTERETLKLLMDMTQIELIVTIARAASKKLTDIDDATSKETERSPAQVDKRRCANR